MQFIPAPLSATTQEFERQMMLFAPHFDHYQIDIQDGVYVPSKTIEVKDYVDSINKLNLEDFKYDFHLMLVDYVPALTALNALNGFKGQINAVFVHLNFDFNTAKNYPNLHICPTFSPPDDVKVYRDVVSSSKSAQVMTINPGPQGQSMMFDQFAKVAQLRKINPNIQICIDGGVNAHTVPQILSLAADQIPDMAGVGSYFSKCQSEAELSGKIAQLSI